MALPVVKIKYEGEGIFSPFTGRKVEGQDGPNKRDPSLLFVYYGEAGLYGFLSKRTIEGAKLKGVRAPDECELAPTTLAKKLTIAGGFVIEVDAGWNGVNWYGFAPVAE